MRLETSHGYINTHTCSVYTEFMVIYSIEIFHLCLKHDKKSQKKSNKMCTKFPYQETVVFRRNAWFVNMISHGVEGNGILCSRVFQQLSAHLWWTGWNISSNEMNSEINNRYSVYVLMDLGANRELCSPKGQNKMFSLHRDHPLLPSE